MKSERLYLVVPGWLKNELRQISERKGITMSEYIKDALKESVKKERKPKANDN